MEMTEFVTRSGVCSPLVALLTSPAVDSTFAKNALTLADALAPFSALQISIRDPISSHELSRKVRVDIRDVQKGGFLLSHTCLPYVLQEKLSCSLPREANKQSSGGEESFSTEFAEAFLTWFGPADHDYLRSYVSCLFVASTSDANPLGELERLQQVQRTQQQGDSSTTLGPSYCCPPKWMGPNILSYFVLLHDASAESDERAKETFTAVCSRYGMQFCHLLRVNSAANVDSAMEMPDPWARVVERRYRGFNRGLELARQALLERAAETNNIAPQDSAEQVMPQLLLSATTQPASSSLFTTSSALQLAPSRPTAKFNGHPNTPSISPIQSLNVDTANNEQSGSSVVESTGPKSPGAYSPLPFMHGHNYTGVHGRFLDTADRERLRDFLEEFVRTALVPYVEKQMSTQGEIITNRKGLGKSITSMRKWLSATTGAAAGPYAGSGGVSTTNSSLGSSISYGPESNEQQTRRLADMALQFGLYSYAHQLYQSLKKDFANDQAWLHHAGALEMSAVSHFLNSLPTGEQSPSTSRQWLHSIQKNYPQRYVEGAINYYVNVCMQPMLAVRCAVLGADILASIGLLSEAAAQLLNASGPALSDFFNAILYGHAAQCFENSERLRRTTFYSILAAHRFSKTGLTTLAYHHYQKGFHLLRQSDKGWNVAESHVLLSVASNKPELSPVGVPSLANLKSLAASAEQQQQLLAYYTSCLKCSGESTPILVLPRVTAQDVIVFHGHTAKASYDASRHVEISSPVFPTDECCEEVDSTYRRSIDAEAVWERLEEAARLLDSAAAPLPPQSQRPFSNRATDNSRAIRAAPLEPTTFQLRLTNPLSIPLTLRDVALESEEMADSALQSATHIPEVHIPAGVEGRSGEAVVEFSLTPSTLTRHLSIDRINMSLCAGDDVWVDGRVPLEVVGRRLTPTKEQRVSNARVADRRLALDIDEEPCPWLEFRISGRTKIAPNHHIIGYCDQFYHLTIDVHNQGAVPVDSLRISTDQPGVVFISQRRNSVPSEATDEWAPCQAHSTPIAANDDYGGAATSVYACDKVALAPSTRTRLQLTVRAPSKPTAALPVRLLFYYHAGNCGRSYSRARQFRYRFFISAQRLLEASVHSLNSRSGLCALRLHLLANDLSVLSRLELLRLSPILSVLPNGASSGQFTDASSREWPTNAPSVLLQAALPDRGAVLLDSGQRLNYCFRCTLFGASANKGGEGLSEVWLGEHPHEALPPRSTPTMICDLAARDAEALQKRHCGRGLAHMQIAVLWRATVTSSEDGKANLVVGETILPSPFVNLCVGAKEGASSQAEIGGWRFVTTTKEMRMNNGDLVEQETAASDQPAGSSNTQDFSNLQLMGTKMTVFQIPWKPT